MPVALLTALCLVLNIAGLALVIRRAESMRAVGGIAIAWTCPFMALQLFIAIWSGIGLVEQDILGAVAFNAAAIAACQLSARRNEMRFRIDAWLAAPQRRAERLTFRPDCSACDKADRCALHPDANKPGAVARLAATIGTTLRRPAVARALAIMLAGVFATLALEIPSNHNLGWMYPLCLLLEWSLVSALLGGLFFLFQRRGAAPAVLSFILFGIGVAEYFVVTFKSMPIAPGDLSALSTAAAVAGTGYTYTLSAWCLYAMGFLCLGLLTCEACPLIRGDRDATGHRALIVNLLVALCCLGGVAGHVTLIDYYHTLQIQVYTWRPLESYYRQGFLPSFISGAQTIKPPKPEDYSVEAAENLLSEYADAFDDGEQATSTARAKAAAQFDAEKPTVIAIMNETFADLSIYQQLHAGYTGPEYFNGLADCLQRGTLYVSAYGGGTCNTEFEFLTGNSMANLGTGVYPYTIYNLTDTENLAAQFKALGYDTTAIHPNHATNWNRENVYSDFGFDRFLSIADYQGAETLRGMVTDAATYDSILTMLDENENPQFIFDVTMQNHSGYNTGLIPADKQVNLSIDGMSDPEVNEYVSLIQESDRALKDFLTSLRSLDRKVVVVFFGDHQPFFPDTFNDQWFTGEDEAAHQERLWQTSYIIWANYDVDGMMQSSERDDLSVNYLGAELMRLIGAPLNDYQKSQLTLCEALPAINTTGFEDSAMRWYLATTETDDQQGNTALAAAEKARQDYAMMQYYEMFGDGSQIYTEHAQTAANETNPNLDPGTTKIK